jgi:two-component system cell cycle response regulator DivK
MMRTRYSSEVVLRTASRIGQETATSMRQNPVTTPDQAADCTPRHILIVEDNKLSLRLLKDLLEVHGYDVVGTALGATAVDLAHQHRPDVILLDIQLPDISGLDAARQLKASDLTRMIPIIAVTAFAMREDKRKILDSGCDFYVAKPFRLGELLEAVEMFIAQHRPVISAFDAASSELERSICIT